MKWSIKLARISGIDLYVHPTFLLLVGFVGINYWLNERSVSAVLDGIAFLLALFTCVVLHEFGHSLAARKYGIQTKDITLLPIGGVARLEKIPYNPKQELWVALAGPAVNAVIAVILLGALILSGTFEPIRLTTYGDRSFLERLLVVNITLILFNLIPAFPMDGGRVDSEQSWPPEWNIHKATQIAATLGKGIALIFALHWPFFKPISDLYRAIRVDRSRPGSQYGANEISIKRNRGRPGNANQFQSSFTRSFAVAIR